MKKLVRLGLSVALPLALLAGCKAAVAPMPDGSLAEVSALGSLGGGKVLSSVPRDGQANVHVSLRVRESAFPAFRVLNLPRSWEEAVVSLHSPTVNDSYDPDNHARSILKADFRTAWTDGSISPIGASANPTYSAPLGVAFDIEGNVYVADQNNHKIRKIAPNGTVTDIGTSANPPLLSPTGVAVDAEGYVYVADPGNNLVRKIAPNGNVTNIDGGQEFSFEAPLSVAVDAQGTLYMGMFTGAIYTISKTGSMSRFAPTVPFVTVRGFAFDSEGNVFVADQGFNGIRKFAPNGAMTVIGSGELSAPFAIAVDYDDHVYVADNGYKHTFVFERVSVNSLVYYQRRSFATMSRGLAIDDAYHLYASMGNMIQKIDLPRPQRKATVQFPPLRPSSDYQARVYLAGADGTPLGSSLAGSQVLGQVPLKSGNNELLFDVVVNGNEASYALTSSNNGNSVTDNAVTKDDVVTLATGMSKDQPGVDRLEVYLEGACYGSPENPALLGVLDEQDKWDTFTWDTTQALEDVTPSLTDATLFNPDTFNGVVPEEADADQFPYANGAITVVSYNDRGERVGVAKFDIRVYAKPEVTIRLK